MVFFAVIFLFPNYAFEAYLDEISFDVGSFRNQSVIKVNLLFSRVEDIYLVFYDKKRKEIYVPYKRDRFDERNEALKNAFVPGLPYQLSLTFKGILFQNQLFLENLPEDPEFRRSAIFVFTLLEYRSLVLDALVF
ncbi:MAG: hypothetical protein NZ853_07790 [Leptospiraceae bacterium]|nr:hypothetical protein [Leptospiraceae bacterium]MDW7976927.1 hypothetical protein [Leptospiraceae bacterium]